MKKARMRTMSEYPSHVIISLSVCRVRSTTPSTITWIDEKGEDHTALRCGEDEFADYRHARIVLINRIKLWKSGAEDDFICACNCLAEIESED